ncbi:MAG: MFS transporter [Clostridia bacterium]|nr:MFS transporter [Clostridia bacterium]
MGEIKKLISNVKEHWNTPAQGNYVPYKEVATIGAAGFGIHWASTLASAIGLSANNFIVGASIGLKPMDLQIMLILANLVGLPIAVFRGWFLDNHKLPGGKFIPILLRTPVPIVIISTIFVWLPYENWEYRTKVVVVWFMFVILSAFLGFYNESFTYLKQVVSPNAQERAHVMSISQVLYSNAPTITNLVIPTIAGLTWGMDNIWTYRIIYPGFTVVGLIVLFIFTPKMKERIIMPKRPVEYVSITDSLREVAKNKYFWIINSATWLGFLEGSSGVMINWTFNYANNGENKVYMGVATTLIANAALWSMLLAPFMIKWLGKRNLLIMHNSINVVLYALLFLVRDNLLLMCVIFYLTTFVNTFQNVYIPNIQADMRDYHQWKTGVRVDGLFTPLTLIGTVLGFFTGLVIPAIYEKMGLLDDYTVLYNDELRNNLFTVLIICSVIGSIMNLIPYLFYDLTEAKHRGYVNVLKIRAMFEDYGNNELDDAQLVDAMKIIKGAKADLQKKKVDKTALKLAKKQKDSDAISLAKAELREIRKHNEFVESLPIVKDELDKFNTERYKARLTAAKETVLLGEVYLYADWGVEKAAARKLPHKTKEEKEIRADALRLAREKKRSARLLAKHGNDNLTIPDERVPEEIKSREINSSRERAQAKKELKAYTKGVSVYRRITKPYNDARNLIIQAENYTHLAEIEALYESVKSKS